MTATGAERIVSALAAEGIPVVFGIPGTQTVPLFEALRLSDVRVVLPKSELGGAFMAAGWARMARRPGVLVTIPGPGFAWALAGLAESRLDSVPLVHITGAPKPIEGRRHGQQQLDQLAIAAPLVKATLDVDSASLLSEAVRKALALAQGTEPGPVLLQVSSRALAGTEADTPFAPQAEALPAGAPEWSALRERMSLARRPVILAGQGAIGAIEPLRVLIERLGAPLLTTPAGRGLLSEDHPQVLGFDPLRQNIQAVNELLDRSDLVVAVGAKLGHNGSAGFQLRLDAARLVHIDADADLLGANYKTSLGIAADATVAIQQLLEAVTRPSDWTPSELVAFRSRILELAKGVEPRVGGNPDGTAAGFFGALRRALPKDVVLVLDSGNHQILARRYFPVLTHTGMLIPTDLQSMGFAIPTAIGARIAAPDRPVVALVGDGGFAMTGLELLTAQQEGIDLTVIVFEDGVLGQIRLHQLRDYGASHATTVTNPRFDLLAESIGATHLDIGTDAEATMREALSRKGVTIVTVPVGDSAAIVRTAITARVRDQVRRRLGPRLLQRVKALFGGRNVRG